MCTLRAVPPFVLILILGAFGVMAFLVWWFRRDAAIKRALRLYPLQRIAEVSEGDMVRVSGRLVYEGEEAVWVKEEAAARWANRKPMR